MPVYHPTLHVEPGDRILAKKEGGWPTTIGGTRLAAGTNEILTVRIHERAQAPTGESPDEWTAGFSIGQNEVPRTDVHIDFISEVIGHADSLIYTRNTEELI